MRHGVMKRNLVRVVGSPTSAHVGVRKCSTVAAASSGQPSQSSSSSEEEQKRVTEARQALIDAIMQRDKEIYTLKRQHELSMLRVEHHQNRILKDQTDRGLYFEQNCNVHTFDTISVGLYSQRNTMYHTMMVQRLREVKIGATLSITALIWGWLYYKYMCNDEWLYVQDPVHFLGATTHVVREAKARIEEEAEKKHFVEQHYGSSSTKSL